MKIAHFFSHLFFAADSIVSAHLKIWFLITEFLDAFFSIDLRDEMAARNKADESQSRLIAQRERRRTMDQSEINSEREIMRLQSMSSGDFTSSMPTNGHDVGSHVDAHNHRGILFPLAKRVEEMPRDKQINQSINRPVKGWIRMMLTYNWLTVLTVIRSLHFDGDCTACVERETELTAALAAHANSKTLIQNLVRKITVSSHIATRCAPLGTVCKIKLGIFPNEWIVSETNLLN